MQRLCKEMMRCMQVARNDIEIESAVERPDELCDSIDAVMCHFDSGVGVQLHIAI